MRECAQLYATRCCCLNDKDRERNKSKRQRSSNGCNKSMEGCKRVLQEDDDTRGRYAEMLSDRKSQSPAGPQVPRQSKFALTVSVGFGNFINRLIDMSCLSEASWQRPSFVRGFCLGVSCRQLIRRMTESSIFVNIQ